MPPLAAPSDEEGPAISTNQVRISGLLPRVTDADIQDFFDPCGCVLAIERPEYEGRPSARAIITFDSVESAQAALRLNDTRLFGRMLDIRAWDPPPPSDTLFIWNLPPQTTIDELWDVFTDPPPVEIRLRRDLASSPIRYAHVQYATVEHALQARDRYDRTTHIGGNTIEVYLARPDEQAAETKARREYNASIPRQPSDTLFVGNLDYTATEDALLNVFKMFHPIEAHLEADASGYPAGCAYVRFQSVENAQKALQARNMMRLLGRPLRLEAALRRPLAPPTKTLYIGNIDIGLPGSAIRDMVAEFCPVALYHSCDKLGRLQPYAHAEFSSIADAERARNACHGRELGGRRLSVAFATGIPRGRAARLADNEPPRRRERASDKPRWKKQIAGQWRFVDDYKTQSYRITERRTKLSGRGFGLRSPDSVRAFIRNSKQSIPKRLSEARQYSLDEDMLVPEDRLSDTEETPTPTPTPSPNQPEFPVAIPSLSLTKGPWTAGLSLKNIAAFSRSREAPCAEDLEPAKAEGRSQGEVHRSTAAEVEDKSDQAHTERQWSRSSTLFSYDSSGTASASASREGSRVL
ncbi:hypothetical protein EIP86_004869 [Pleurotus ostreatoroseus]|nr:hypothetical protein EIP86_004869 [Pleurotus ostreatoroseus]